MIIHSEIKKWGNSLGLRVTGQIKDLPQFEEGTKVDIEVTSKGFKVTKAKESRKKIFPFSEDELLCDMTPFSVHADIIAKPLDSELGE